MALIGRGRVLGRKITSDGVHSGPREEPDEPDKEDGLPVWPAEEGKGPERGSAVTRQRDRNIVIGCDPPQRQRVGGARRPCWNCWLFRPRKIFWDGLTMMMMMTMTDVDVKADLTDVSLLAEIPINLSGWLDPGGGALCSLFLLDGNFAISPDRPRRWSKSARAFRAFLRDSQPCGWCQAASVWGKQQGLVHFWLPMTTTTLGMGDNIIAQPPLATGVKDEAHQCKCKMPHIGANELLQSFP
ncbi:uncharacterized protein BO96DRAFT_465186 [Aspergillus niger CBS 101883]|uniref:uncharacterized protein n=1 Tax=Aspergillus lacticoffeatus (strain CBS 101883) TaxID=1450533 RepID=UPI000D7F3CFC|nr:uncharacterized protein BO96DRAFT_465186 [Aspergillus niger CBS 101883]PYH57563.1 hypothetical protein BO96DRAFT_465186 [Aspergillus niger CBS 101883]